MGYSYQSMSEMINKGATARNVDVLLKDYQHKRMLALRANVLRASVIDGQPHGVPDSESTERHITDKIDAAEFVTACDNALVNVKDILGAWEATPLILTYFHPAPNDTAIMERMGLEHTAYYQRKKQAQIAFAEVFPNRWGELLVYQ